MVVSLSELWQFTKSIPSSRNFIEGESVLNVGHVMLCDRLSEQQDNVCKLFITFCMQSSNLRNHPHEIKGSISFNGKIIDVKFSCKAGLSKNAVVVFLFLSRLVFIIYLLVMIFKTN